MNLKAVWTLLKDTVQEWQTDKVPLLAAALAYYTIFSLAPLLTIVIAIAGFVFGPDAARNQLDEQIQGLVGAQGADAIQTMIQNAYNPSSGIIATVISVVTLLLGASGVFAQLQDALNTIWEVPPPQEGVKGMVKARATSFAMILVIGFLLLVSLVASTVLATVGNFFGHLIPGLAILWQVVNFVISFGVITLLFALIYRVLPDVRVPWGDVWHGAIVTALLFTVGKWLLGLYLGNSGVASPYGAAGSFVVVLVWVYYSAQILLFGAEFTQVYSKHYGSKWRIARNNAPLETKTDAKLS
uniref:YihY/virulence factor BrkB family protein n=1 Tax=Trichocoleus desertorum TaxID=1481672 RepID=UPI0025B56ABF|nr:YihY/virulence factor BrkB family protein [Trichocoleus desertorum]